MPATTPSARSTGDPSPQVATCCATVDEHDDEIPRSSDRINSTGIRKAIGLHLACDTKSAGRVLGEGGFGQVIDAVK